MKHKLYSVLLTALLGMFGMNAWAQELPTTLIDGTEYYEIGNADDLVTFAQIVNGGEPTANAVLTDDIDCSSISSWTPIGNSGDSNEDGKFHGIFDGQGHTISNLVFTMAGNAGLFDTTAGFTLKNFIVDGSCSITTTNNCAGLIGRHQSKNSTLKSTISGVGFAADVKTTGANGENPAGLIGGCWGKSGVEILIEKSWTSGIITSSENRKGNCGAFVGWINGGKLLVNDSWSIATVNTASADKYLVRPASNNSTAVTFSNCYSLNGTQVTKLEGVTAADLSTGAITYALNGKSSENPVWFQKLKNKTFIAEQYVVTTNGTTEDPTTATITLTEADNETFTFTLPNFVLKIIGQTFPIGTISLTDITIGDDGTFSKEGTYDVPDENIPPSLSYFASSFKNIPYTLTGKVNNENNNFYAEVNLTVMGNTINVKAGTDDFDAAAPTGDPYPMPSGNYVVYRNGSLHCDGSAYEDTYYSNQNLGMMQDDHTFAEGFCTYCSYPDVTYMTANVEDYFEIGTGHQLKWFAAYANQVNPAANAILTADIDMTGVEWTPIGKTANYGGTFDGQGFTISNFNYIGSGDYNGLFGKVVDATVKNFSINGFLVCAGQGNGTIGWGEGAFISNVHSALTITTPATGAIVHGGGIIGDARYGGTQGGSTVQYCSFSGTLTINADSHDCFAGIVGYVNDYCLINGCANYGTISYAKSNCYVGGILGYVNNNYCYGTHNCLNVGEVIYTGEGEPSYGGAIVGRLRNNDPALWGNSYWKEGSAANACGENQISKTFEVTAEQLASGEVAYKLGTAFRQNIGTDATPVLDATHGIVNEITEAGYATMYIPDTSVEIPAGVEAFTGKINGEKFVLSPVQNVVIKGQAVVLKGAAGYYSFMPTEAGLGLVESDLIGAAEDIEAAGKYVLAKPEGEEVGFYKAASGTIKAGKAYLDIPDGSSVKGFTFAFGDDATSLNEELRMKNEELEGAVIYNVAGQRINKMQNGINIVNGKKILK